MPCISFLALESVVALCIFIEAYVYFFFLQPEMECHHHVNEYPDDGVSISGRLSLFSWTCPLLLNAACT